MAPKPESRPLVSSPPAHLNPLLTLPSLPFRCWLRIWSALRSSPPTRRPPQNPPSTVRTQLTVSNDSGDLKLKIHPLFLARDTTFSSTNRLWICHLLYESECFTPECGALKSPAVNRSYRQEWDTDSLLFPAEAVKSRKPYDGCCG
jgi:hypothetical protein